MKVFFIVISVFIAGWIFYPTPSKAQNQTKKYDGDCTGTETAGRCADKPVVDPQPTPATEEIVFTSEGK